ncbi:hypothetical protein WM40_03595 [Robbsia andropogonis]|uniref:Uncharacterized protein n=1 Tax=Robbsia andropogonis TaxID=28092 RepID=A0A0F5K536_9BURK|nr:hypothetical protein WM40_03595 [Robbsia andropogonis]
MKGKDIIEMMPVTTTITPCVAVPGEHPISMRPLARGPHQSEPREETAIVTKAAFPHLLFHKRRP